MSGTSLDGIDCVVVNFENQKLSIVGSHTQKFPSELRSLLLHLASERSVDLDLLTRTNFVLATEYARAVEELLRDSKRTPRDIKAIGLHGQTIRHLPEPTAIGKDLPAVGATLQLGSGSALAVLSGIDVVSDFRSADVALGGQGAPLVPMFDAAFLHSRAQNRIALNIGGIANLTWLPKSADRSSIMAFDTGPGNMLIDALAAEYFQKPYDDGGEIGQHGKIAARFLSELLENPYFATAPPKSTGRELFGRHFFARFQEAIARGDLEPADAIATATELTARSIAESIRWLPIEDGSQAETEIIVSGGGAYNRFLLERLRSITRCSVQLSDDLGIPVQMKEAIAFAFFAKAFVATEIIHLPQTTGAKSATLLGSFSHHAG